jgi:hypothetical protein
MAKRTVTYKPAPVDLDNDGIVQEGTPFERPVDEVIEETENFTPTPVPNPCCYTVQDGDSYAAIAGMFPTEGMTKHERAQELYQLNGGKPLNPGTEVKL